MESRAVIMIKKEILNNLLLSDNIKEKLESQKNLIFNIIPELKLEDGFDQNHPHHCYDVWEHTKVALEKSNKDLETRLALLLHDIGKPHSYQDEEVRHFHGHPEVGAKMSEKILKELRYSDRTVNNVCFLIKNHDKIIDFNNLDDLETKDLGLIDKLLNIQYCDAYAHAPEHIEKRINKLNVIKEQFEKYKMEKTKDDNER